MRQVHELMLNFFRKSVIERQRYYVKGLRLASPSSHDGERGKYTQSRTNHLGLSVKIPGLESAMHTEEDV